MQWLAALCVRRPVFATVLILALVVIGIFGYLQLGVDRMPKVDFPTIIVTTVNPGASAEEIDTEVSDKIEESVNTISGLDELRSTSAEGVSIVVATFLLEKNGDVAAQEVRDQVNRVMPNLPQTIRQPVIQKFDPDSSPVLTIAVSSRRPIRDTTEFADKVLRRALENVNGVGQVLVVGGRQRQINVWLDAARLRAYNITVNEVARALQSQNIEVPGGRLETGPQWISVRTRGRVQSVGEFNQIVVRQRDTYPITIADVATVEDGMAEPASLSNVNGAPAVTLQIRRQSGTNTVAVVDEVKRRLDQLRPTLPPDYDIRLMRDSSEYIKASIDTVKEHLVLGSILAALVVAFFLWNLRSTIIAAIAIPTSIISTFGLIWYEGFTLNSMTMLGLTLSVGIVIDDAIVVIENIYRHIEEKGSPPMRAAVEATREIGLAVLSTTLSLSAIFLPMAFMGGIVGRFMQSFGLTMAFAVMVSLLVSFSLTPMLGARWLRAVAGASKGHGSKDSWFFHHIDQGYTRLLEFALGHRRWVLAVAGLVFLSTVPLGIVVKKNFLPVDDMNEFLVNLRAPEGTSLPSTEVITNRVAAAIRERTPEALYTLVTVASDAATTPNVSTIYVKLSDLDKRERSQFDIQNDVRDNVLPKFVSEHLRTAVRPTSTMGGGSGDVQFLLNGPDLDVMARYANRIAAETAKFPGAVDVDTSLNLGKPEVQVSLNRPKAADLGVQVADVAGALRWLVGGDEVTTYNEGGEQYEVHLRARAEDRASQGAVGQFTVPSSRLGSIPLENLALVQRGEAPTQIDRYQRQRQVTILANLLPGYSQMPVMTAMQKAADDLAMPASYKTTLVGQSREMGRAAQNFLLAFGLSLVFMYLILAAQFESWLHPVTILLSLPLTLPFAIFSLVIVGQSMNIMSALGLFVLFGVVKKNSILQIDKANQLMAEGNPAHEAVLEACRLRLRPILMTTAAFVAGMVPLVVSGGVGAGTNRSIGFVIIGGQSLALLLTLVATPVAYSLFDDVRRHFGKRPESAMKVGAITVIAVVAITGLASRAAAQGAPPKGDATRAPMRLTLDDAVRLALQNNLDIAVDRLEPQAATQKAAQASAAFKPAFASVFASTHQVQAPANLLVNAGGTTTDAFTSTLGIGQRLPWAGTTYSVGWNAVRTTTNSFFNSFSPGITSQLVVAFSQPLARDLSLDAARQQLIVTKRNQAITDTRFRETVVRTLADVKKGYWNLVAARALVDVQQKSLDLAVELVRTNTSRVEVGSSPPLDLLSAKAEQAQREENLVSAKVTARQAEDALRLLIFDPNDTSFWDVAIDPADTTPINVPLPDLDAIVKRALENRQDLIRARLDVANAETSVKYYKSQRLPDLRLQGSYGASGLGGTRWVRTGGFPGTITGSEDTGFGTVLNQLFDRNWPNWTFGFSFSYPIGYSYEKAGLANARIQENQARLRLESAETKTVRQLRQAAWQLEANQKRIDTSRAAREFQEQRLQAEQKRYEVGMSTSFLVIQAQRDVVQASNNVLVAALEYVRAVIDFEALQEAGPAGSSSGSSMAVSGGSVVAIPVTTGISALGSSSSRIGGM